ncbi:MAG: hypothetical protein COZ18_11055 [Flexibacter sp. CG_4_10_14_3_um_filter_32_15]|nr:MAG: hypothetical protein COZ18_11055 [Flexibacter sp. CG_4_10_14_3_um_filter_32_15]
MSSFVKRLSPKLKLNNMNKFYLLLIISFLLNSSFIGFTNIKKEFKVSYKYVRNQNLSTKKWSDWKSSKNTFIFNINPNGDIRHINPTNQIYIFRYLTKEVELSRGQPYDVIWVQASDGNICLIQYFYDDKKGLHISLDGRFEIEFAN